MNTQEIVDKTGKRAESFALMLNSLATVPSPLIIETGCARQEDNFTGDGMSTLLFDTYIGERGEGEFLSVDISQENVNFANSVVKNSVVHCSDSVAFLYNVAKYCKDTNRFVDLLYLDSFDFDPGNPHPSSLHHIFELTAIMPALRPGTVIAVDDNFDNIGKGGYVKEFMDLLGKERVYSGYQWVWVW